MTTVDLVLPAAPDTGSASGVLTYTLALADVLARDAEFHPRLIGIGEAGSCTPDSDVTWLPVAHRAGPIGLSYHLGLRRYVLSSRQELHAHVIHAQRPDYLWHFHRHGKPRPATVCTLHGPHMLNVRRAWGKFGGALYERVQRAALRDVHAAIAVSRDTERFFLDLYPWLEGRTQTIHVGVNTEAFRPADTAEMRAKLRLPAEVKALLFVGRFHPQKNVPLLLRTVSILSPRNPELRLWLIGEGPEEAALRQLSHDLRIADRCTFAGRLEPRAVGEYMNAADLLALSSVWEGMPTVVLEALASGLPCVCTRVGDVGDAVVDGETGYVVESEPEALAEGIEKALARPRGEWTGACRRAARQFDWSVIGQRTIDVYRRVMSGRNGTGR